jgi:hypothetical protein
MIIMTNGNWHGENISPLKKSYRELIGEHATHKTIKYIW